MFAIGCIQAQSCHTDKCPTGVTSQDPSRWRAIVVSDKARRVANFHAATVEALGELVAAGTVPPQGAVAPALLPARVARRICHLCRALSRFAARGAADRVQQPEICRVLACGTGRNLPFLDRPSVEGGLRGGSRRTPGHSCLLQRASGGLKNVQTRFIRFFVHLDRELMRFRLYGGKNQWLAGPSVMCAVDVVWCRRVG